MLYRVEKDAGGALSWPHRLGSTNECDEKMTCKALSVAEI
jgi:hypothetical protein